MSAQMEISPGERRLNVFNGLLNLPSELRGLGVEPRHLRLSNRARLRSFSTLFCDLGRKRILPSALPLGGCLPTCAFFRQFGFLPSAKLFGLACLLLLKLGSCLLSAFRLLLPFAYSTRLPRHLLSFGLLSLANARPLCSLLLAQSRGLGPLLLRPGLFRLPLMPTSFLLPLTQRSLPLGIDLRKKTLLRQVAPKLAVPT
jgi:hypothetical protein